MQLTSYPEVWLVDFEFGAAPGERVEPRCLVAHELHSAKTIRIWKDEFDDRPPYGVGRRDSLFVAFLTSAELGCHLALDWPLPENILDLYVEFRRLTNGLPIASSGLLGALTYFGLDAMDAAEKNEMIQLALRGGSYTAEEQKALLDYCHADVKALGRLLLKMAPRLDMPRALLRGRYMAAVARMEHRGIPIDKAALQRLSANWATIKAELVDRLDHAGVFRGTTFDTARFSAFITRLGIAWPKTATGRLELRDDTFKDMSRVYPELRPIRDLRHALGKLRLTAVAVGSEGRNRCMLSPFRSKTGRNQPSNSKFIFGAASWLRGLIRPRPGMAIAYLDWSQQEFGIAAALSGDQAMMAAYTSGDPYMAFAIQAGAAPDGATKTSHPAIRERFKQCVLAVQYGMGAESLAIRIGQSPAHAQELLDMHRQTYPAYWAWSDAIVDHALLHGYLDTTFGWRLHVPPGKVNDRSLRNYPVQANGAEMLRLACIIATEMGVGLCGPVHDAVLIEAEEDQIDTAVSAMKTAMLSASRLVLDGFELRSDADVIAYPERWGLKGPAALMWGEVWAILDDQQVLHPCNVDVAPAHTRTISSCM